MLVLIKIDGIYIYIYILNSLDVLIKIDVSYFLEFFGCFDEN